MIPPTIDLVSIMFDERNTEKLKAVPVYKDTGGKTHKQH